MTVPSSVRVGIPSGTSTLRDARWAVAATAMSGAVLLGSCQGAGTQTSLATDHPTDAGSVGFSSGAEALSAQRAPALESLDEALGMFDSLDPAQVERYRRELTPPCTFEPDPPLSVNVGTRFESDDPEAAVEDAAAAAAETAWTTVESTSSSDQTYFFRRGDSS